jgi:zinc transporter 9
LEDIEVTTSPTVSDTNADSDDWVSADAQRPMNPLPKETSRMVWLALAGNAAITTLKAAVWLRSGSSAMLAETIHTLVDTLNQGLLALGLRQSAFKPDRHHQYGYGRAAFVWGLVSALGLFWAGAGVSIFHGA